MDGEIWKEIKGFNQLYQISNFGRVKSFHFGKERILRPGKNTGGYLHVALCLDGKSYIRLVHILVASTFLGEIPEDYQVNHLDGVRDNPTLTNLEIVSPSQNVRHAIDVLKRKIGGRGLRKVSESRRRQIFELHAQGVPIEEIARKTITFHKVVRALIEAVSHPVQQPNQDS